MSKESYIRGFCKAAEAHGVDPQALAKLASGEEPRYNTGGWAPSVARGENVRRPPIFRNGRLFSYQPREGFSYGHIQDFYDGETNPAIMDLIKSMHPSSEWWKAHNESLKEADRVRSRAMGELVPAENNFINRIRYAFTGKHPQKRFFSSDETADLAGKAYHSSMMSLTGTPTRVSAPVKK